MGRAAGSGAKPVAGLAGDHRLQDTALGLRRGKGHGGELLGAAHPRAFGQDAVRLARLSSQMLRNRRRPAARSRAARSRIAPPGTCGIRAAGVPLRGL
jgi:hypothetical protein